MVFSLTKNAITAACFALFLAGNAAFATAQPTETTAPAKTTAAAPTSAPQAQSCAGNDLPCLLGELDTLTGKIDNQRWRDQTYRELAKLLALRKQTDEAILVLRKIKTPDTQALTIRGIGMNAAKTDMTQAQFDDLFKKLRVEAETIQHPPSYAIALTYIAMAQAFANNDDGALATAESMKNRELRNKALGESSEIQAEKGKMDEAFRSIAAIDDPAYRNKAHLTISKIFADRGMYDKALASAAKIENAYQHADAVLYLLAKQISPEEVKLQ